MVFSKTFFLGVFKRRDCVVGVNPSRSDNFLDCTKLDVFADDKINFGKMMISVFDGVGNILGKGENAGNHNVFIRFLQGPEKPRLCGKELNLKSSFMALIAFFNWCRSRSGCTKLTD